jgi:hypothetical protein
LDSIPLAECGEIVRPHLREKRLFISACSVANRNLARNIFPLSECNSVVGPATDIGFDDAAILWASFYHLMFKEDFKKMKGKNIELILQTLADTFNVILSYFAADNESPEGFKLELFSAQR